MTIHYGSDDEDYIVFGSNNFNRFKSERISSDNTVEEYVWYTTADVFSDDEQSFE